LSENEPDCENLTSYLNDNNLTWPEIEEIWKKTINYRLKFIKENETTSIFHTWKQYTLPMGYKLVIIIIFVKLTNLFNFR